MSLKNLGADAGEGFIEDVSSNIVRNYASKMFLPMLKKLEEDESMTGQALHGAISTLTFGITSAVTVAVTNYAITKSITSMALIYSFLKTTNVAGKTRGVISGVLGGIPIVGKSLSKVVNVTAGFITKDRQIIAQMVNDSSNNLSNIVSRERQTQAQISYYKNNSLNSTMSNVLRAKSSSSTANTSTPLVNFTHKMETGTWTTSRKDKLIYEKATKQIISKTVGLSWSKSYIDKLNSYSQFATDAKGTIVNLAQSQLDVLAASAHERVN